MQVRGSNVPAIFSSTPKVQMQPGYATQPLNLRQFGHEIYNLFLCILECGSLKIMCIIQYPSIYPSISYKEINPGRGMEFSSRKRDFDGT